MSVWEITVIALALAIDAFTVGIAVGLSCGKPRQIFRLSLHFGVFQALLPLIGALFGLILEQYISVFDDILVFTILSLLGVKMIYSSFTTRQDEKTKNIDLTKGFSLISLSTAVSIDAFAVGITLPAANAPIAYSVAIIGIVAALLTLTGMLLAAKLQRFIGKHAEAAAGLVLIALGVKALF